MKGFSPRNLKYMRAFAEAWPQEEFVQQVAAQIPWFHNCVLLDKLQRKDDRIWYASAIIHHGWSRNVLVHQIETQLHKRSGAAVTNSRGRFQRRSRIWPGRSQKIHIPSISLRLAQTCANGSWSGIYSLT